MLFGELLSRYQVLATIRQAFGLNYSISLWKVVILMYRLPAKIKDVVSFLASAVHLGLRLF